MTFDWDYEHAMWEEENVHTSRAGSAADRGEDEESWGPWHAEEANYDQARDRRSTATASTSAVQTAAKAATVAWGSWAVPKGNAQDVCEAPSQDQGNAMIYIIMGMLVTYVLGLVSAHIWTTYVPTTRDAGFYLLRWFLKFFKAMMKRIFGEDSSIAVQSNLLSEVASTSQQTSTPMDPQPMEVDESHLDAPEPEETKMFPVPPGAVFCETCNEWLSSTSNYLEHRSGKRHNRRARAIAGSTATIAEAEASWGINAMITVSNSGAFTPGPAVEAVNTEIATAQELTASALFADTASNGSFSMVSDLPGSTGLPPMGSTDTSPLAALAGEFAACTEVYYYPLGNPSTFSAEAIPGGNRFHLFEDCAGQHGSDRSRRQSRKICKCCLQKIQRAVSQS